MIVIADDIMIVDKKQNHRDHDIAFKTLLETARKCNVKLNTDKLHYKKKKVDFFGETYTTDGCKSAQNKVSAIVEMPALTCKKQVQCFIGMVNYQITQQLPVRSDSLHQLRVSMQADDELALLKHTIMQG